MGRRKKSYYKDRNKEHHADGDSRRYVKLVCSRCGREYDMCTSENNIEYWNTRKEKKDYICLLCKN